MPKFQFKHMNPLWLFAFEGAMLQFATSINGITNNLYATHLGATDAQVALTQAVPNTIAVLLMLPVGIWADRARSSRVIPLITLLFMTAGFLLITAVPAMGAMGLTLFFVALAATAGGPAIYNAQWQNFFGDVVPPDNRNDVLTMRNRFMFFVGVSLPLVCGALLALRADSDWKLRMMQLSFLVCGIAAVIQFVIVSRIPAPIRKNRTARYGFRDVGETVKTLVHSREFMAFFIPALLFYMSWQCDWSMWYIGQTQYLMLNEAQLAVYNGIFNFGQLFAVGIVSRNVSKKGSDFGLMLAGLGLISCPVIMVCCSMLPLAMRMNTFTVSTMLFNAPQCAIALCVVQILLRVAPKQCRTMTVALFTLSTTLTNCFMPSVGVKVYSLLGSDYRGLLLFNILVFLFRIFTSILLYRRYHNLKKEEKI